MAAANDTLWAVTDRMGSVTGMLDSAGTERLHRAFDSYGNVVSETHYDSGGDEVLDGSGFVGTAFGFQGRWLDADTGLQNNLNRWYDSQLGRFISEDPSGFAAGDANLYRSFGNSPTNYTDPSGLDAGGRLPVEPEPEPGSAEWSRKHRCDIDDRPLQPTWSPFDFFAGWGGEFLARPALPVPPAVKPPIRGNRYDYCPKGPEKLPERLLINPITGGPKL